MVASYFAFVVFACMPILSSASSYPTTRYLNSGCNSVYSMSSSALLKFSSITSYASRGYRCETSFSTYNTNRKIKARVTYIDLRFTCQTTGLVISDSSSTLTPNDGICGTSTPFKSYVSSQEEMHFDLHNTGSRTYVDFTVLLTAFSYKNNGSCSGGDFACGNSYCIPSSLTCNGYNDCDDNSDEVDGCGLSTGVVVGMSFGIIIFFVVLVVVLIIFRRRRRYVRVTETVRAYPTVQTTTTSYKPSYGGQGPNYQSI